MTKKEKKKKPAALTEESLDGSLNSSVSWFGSGWDMEGQG